jgi:hypothetical protein
VVLSPGVGGDDEHWSDGDTTSGQNRLKPGGGVEGVWASLYAQKSNKI